MTTFLEWCARKQVLGTSRFASKHLGNTHEKVRSGKRKFKRCGACSQKVHVVAGKAEKTTNHKAKRDVDRVKEEVIKFHSLYLP